MGNFRAILKTLILSENCCGYLLGNFLFQDMVTLIGCNAASLFLVSLLSARRTLQTNLFLHKIIFCDKIY